ncbi:peptide deformylase [Glutamicibacter sp. MNS18]|uniref:peptide deformylase n=1 Tax=Glutamicibacter sp. MNS18 TaxID=2989817 RepID=UPI00223632B8|nr:peptide deformylase [Glutamicibacter sp. MNS18]MCW4464880.1 peptide deformylase [Glutamicibacter sp. MNS18]
MDYNTMGPAEITALVDGILEQAPDQVAPIVQLGHPALRQPALAYTGQLDPSMLDRLFEVMRATMHAAPGVGLAAVQIGVPLALAVLEDQYEISEQSATERDRQPLEYLEFINPGYTPHGAAQAAFYEGCLSFAGFQAVVTRPTMVMATYQDRAGTQITRDFTGWQARIVQHEIDHLAGCVYIDKAETRSLVSQSEAIRYPGFDLDQARNTLGF